MAQSAAFHRTVLSCQLLAMLDVHCGETPPVEQSLTGHRQTTITHRCPLPLPPLMTTAPDHAAGTWHRGGILVGYSGETISRSAVEATKMG